MSIYSSLFSVTPVSALSAHAAFRGHFEVRLVLLFLELGAAANDE